MSATREEAMLDSSSGNAVKLVLAWGFVGIPLAWGVIETVVNALKLFQ